MPAPDAIAPDKLCKVIGTPECPIVLGNRRDAVRSAELPLLPGGRVLADADPELVPVISDLSGPVVVACGEGQAKSQRLAARLRSRDTAPEHLDAGMSLYDAFCRWSHDATGETRNRPTNRPGGAA